ncbi:MAG: bifunctional 2-polyprenyl-6-hydroxyphenol methylase/3-demethylubiquinol 3-O-methyltransferase UbiG [Gammaproteobacteria bacterium]|nr:bifunctional 2-polyprenyl-6-hydroxyphenol methylase/3-demethylubiquinol 3-O-methyltransferase UbiG [Gammaproteobacteria bacterium]
MTFYVNDTGGNGVNPGAANVDSREIAKFEALAHRWWDPDGDFKPLHDINPVRVAYIAGRCAIAGQPVIDIGCGGGILTESLAGLGADVTGIDMAEGPLTVAKLHAFETGCTDVRYELATPEAFAAVEPERFELVTCLEMLEHVPDIQSTIDALARLAAPGGHIVLSTINRHPKAYALAVIGAEYVLNLLPRGTHDYQKFIKPSELASAVRNAGLSPVEIRGLRYNPFTRRASLSDDVDINYMLYATKP